MNAQEARKIAANAPREAALAQYREVIGCIELSARRGFFCIEYEKPFLEGVKSMLEEAGYEVWVNFDIKMNFISWKQ